MLLLACSLYFSQYYDMFSITEVVERVKGVLHVEPTPFATGLQETYQWYLERGERRQPDFSFADRLIREAGTA
jgi:hypothetical protein